MRVPSSPSHTELQGRTSLSVFWQDADFYYALGLLATSPIKPPFTYAADGCIAYLLPACSVNFMEQVLQ